MSFPTVIVKVANSVKPLKTLECTETLLIDQVRINRSFLHKCDN